MTLPDLERNKAEHTARSCGARRPRRICLIAHSPRRHSKKQKGEPMAPLFASLGPARRLVLRAVFRNLMTVPVPDPRRMPAMMAVVRRCAVHCLRLAYIDAGRCRRSNSHSGYRCHQSWSHS